MAHQTMEKLMAPPPPPSPLSEVDKENFSPPLTSSQKEIEKMEFNFTAILAHGESLSEDPLPTDSRQQSSSLQAHKEKMQNLVLNLNN